MGGWGGIESSHGTAELGSVAGMARAVRQEDNPREGQLVLSMGAGCTSGACGMGKDASSAGATARTAEPCVRCFLPHPRFGLVWAGIYNPLLLCSL